MTIMTVIFDLFRHNGINVKNGELAGIQTGDFTQFKDFEEMFSAWEKQFKYCVGIVGERNNVELKVTQEVLPDPLRSALMYQGIESGKDIWARHDIPFDNTASVCTIGMVNVGDSLAAIKKLCFDDKKYTLKELYDALEADWVGYETMQRDFKNAPSSATTIPMWTRSWPGATSSSPISCPPCPPSPAAPPCPAASPSPATSPAAC